MRDGWDNLFSEAESILPVEQKQDDTDLQFVRCFSTEAGQEVLEYLKSVTVDQPTWYPGEDPSHGFAREGQNSIVREIIKRIERGRNQ